MFEIPQEAPDVLAWDASGELIAYANQAARPFGSWKVDADEAPLPVLQTRYVGHLTWSPKKSCPATVVQFVSVSVDPHLASAPRQTPRELLAGVVAWTNDGERLDVAPAS